MGCIIGSFNAYFNNSQAQYGGVGTHDIDKMVNIILSERFDIVALQEIKQEALGLLKNRLRDWECRYVAPGGYFHNVGLGYLWNTKRVRECSESGPVLFGDYHSTYYRMKRNPYYARFMPSESSGGALGGGFFEIRLINVHLKSKMQHQATFQQNEARRKMELKLITGEIYNLISEKGYGDFRPPYTIVLGDYNFLCSECQQVTMGTGATTKQEELTWINRNGSFESDFDHFSYNEGRFAGTNVIIKRVNSVQDYCQNNFDEHRKTVSDHVPIKLELDLNPERR